MELEVEVTESIAGDAGATTSRRSNMSVVWNRDLLVYDGPPEVRVVLDFRRQRRQKLDLKAGVFSDDSLFAEVGLRYFELPNRAHIRATLEAGGADGSGFAPLAVEHQLSLLPPNSDTRLSRQPDLPTSSVDRLRAFLGLRSPTPRQGIVVSQSDDRVAYTQGGRTLLLYQPGRGPLGSADALVQVVRHRWGGHPLILEELAALSRLPEQVEVFALAPAPFDAGPVVLRPVAMRALPDWTPPSTKDLRFVVSLGNSDPLDALLGATPTRATTSIEERLGRVRVTLPRDPVYAFLSFCELTLEVNVTMPEDIRAALDTSSDPDLKELTRALSAARDHASAERSLVVLERLREGRHDLPAALDVFAGEMSMASRKSDRAKEALGRALAANPRLVGAYKTLGDLFMSSCQAARAWRCWDLARSLSLDHPVLNDVFELEERLGKECPAYFRPPALT